MNDIRHHIDLINEFSLFGSLKSKRAKEIRTALKTICLNWVGDGAFRDVYQHRNDPSLVVKIENEGENSKKTVNQMEYDNWQEISKNPELRDWFAPCVRISKHGAVLIQKKVEPIKEGDMPDEVPAGFIHSYDCTRLRNWGMLDGRAVCCDYSFINLKDFNYKTKMFPIEVNRGFEYFYRAV